MDLVIHFLERDPLLVVVEDAKLEASDFIMIVVMTIVKTAITIMAVNQDLTTTRQSVPIILPLPMKIILYKAI